MQIERVEIQVIGSETERYTWSDDLPEQYQSNTLLRVYTDAGLEGIAGIWNATSFGYDRYTAESLRHLVPILIGRDPCERESILHDLRPRVFPQPPGALAVIDIALWDIMGKIQDKPIYQLLGGAMERIPAYASTPMYADIDTYMSVVAELVDQGFQAVKFHTWCTPDRDLALAREARRQFPDLTLMLDAENNYDLDSAIEVAKALDALAFTWFEAPLPDWDLTGYRKLTRAVDIPIIPSGNWIQDLSLFEEALKTGAWNTTRTDATILGGITPVQKAVSLSAEAGMKCELMSWGYTLPSAANLHLMLGCGHCSYYEQPLPYKTFEYGMHDVLRTASDGYVYAPTGPGLGLAVDWPAMEAATVHRIICDHNSTR